MVQQVVMEIELVREIHASSTAVIIHLHRILYRHPFLAPLTNQNKPTYLQMIRTPLEKNLVLSQYIRWFKFATIDNTYSYRFGNRSSFCQSALASHGCD